MSAEAIGWIASIVFLMRLLPQPVRIYRTGVPDGVSPMSAMNATISDFGWMIYGLANDDVPVWLVASVALVPSFWNAMLLRKQATLRDGLGAALWFSIIMATWFSGTLGIVLAGTVLVCQGPQVWTAIRSRDLGGIATTTWWIAIVDAGMWGLYGVAQQDVALIGYGVVLLASAVTILARVYWTRRMPARTLALEPTLA